MVRRVVYVPNVAPVGFVDQPSPPMLQRASIGEHVARRAAQRLIGAHVSRVERNESTGQVHRYSVEPRRSK